MSDFDIDPEDSADIRLLEHLISYTWNVLDSFQEGGLEDLASAKMKIAQELHRCNSAAFLLEDGAIVGWLRLSWPNHDALSLLMELKERVVGEVLTVRWLGPRQEGGEVVTYTTVGCASFEEFIEIVKGLRDVGVEIRDANYGGVVL